MCLTRLGVAGGEDMIVIVGGAPRSAGSAAVMMMAWRRQTRSRGNAVERVVIFAVRSASDILLMLCMLEFFSLRSATCAEAQSFVEK